MHNFLELPLSVSFSFGSDRVRGFIGGGGYIGIRFLQAVAGRTMLGSESLENMTSVPNSSYVFTFIDFNLNLQESPPSNRSERWRGKEEKSSDVISLQYE